MAVSILACCVVLMLYHHVGYPFLLRLLARRIERRRSLSRSRRPRFRPRSSDPVGRIAHSRSQRRAGHSAQDDQLCGTRLSAGEARDRHCARRLQGRHGNGPDGDAGRISLRQRPGCGNRTQHRKDRRPQPPHTRNASRSGRAERRVGPLEPGCNRASRAPFHRSACRGGLRDIFHARGCFAG